MPSSLRGSDVALRLGSTCESGYEDGRTHTWMIWNNKLGADCYNVWDLERRANILIALKYSDDSNWKNQSFNECAKDAVHAEVQRIEKVCLEDDSSQCTELGNTAAELVIENRWCVPERPGISPYTTTQDYKANCKEVATSICKGQIPNVANQWISEQAMTTSQMLELQGECEEQVNDMVPGEESVLKGE